MPKKEDPQLALNNLLTSLKTTPNILETQLYRDLDQALELTPQDNRRMAISYLEGEIAKPKWGLAQKERNNLTTLLERYKSTLEPSIQSDPRLERTDPRGEGLNATIQGTSHQSYIPPPTVVAPR